MTLYPVILCGGAGTRLWPVSRPSRPKQFADLVAHDSLFRQTVARAKALDGVAGLLVVANACHGPAVVAQLGEDAAGATVVLEPVARDSAAAIAAAAVVIAELDPEGIALVLPSDHYIPVVSDFVAAARTALVSAQGGAIVTFGLTAAHPSVAYGYIRPGAPMDGAFRVDRFAEKPDEATARTYVEQGYLWNSGMFVAKASVLVAEFEAFAPEVLAAARAAVAGGRRQGGALTLGDAFARAPKISFDFAVMEHTRRAAVVPSAMTWSDLGAWDAVWAAAPKSADRNVTVGDVVLHDSEACYVYSGGSTLITVLGGRNLAVIAEPDAVLVCDLDRAQDVKAIVARLSAAGRAELDFAPATSTPPVGARAMWTWFTASALPLWWALGADHVGGGFHEALDADGGPVASDRRCRVQARQVYAFATAGAAGWKGPWREAVGHGLAYLDRAYRRDDGLYRTRVDAAGAIADDAAAVMDQAFVLLALGSAAGGLPEHAGVLERQALDLVARLASWRAGGGEAFAPGPDADLETNPHMHLFEAALAWVEAGGDSSWRALAGEMASLCLRRFVQADDLVPEAFAPDWTASRAPAAGDVSPGRQFEWAWLLARWARLSGEPRLSEAARRLYAAGLRGIDAARNVAVDACTSDLAVKDAGARLWPQTERLKAAAILGERAEALSAAASLWRYLQTPIPGLWRDQMTPGGDFVEAPAPASSLYHLSAAALELHRAGWEA